MKMVGKSKGSKVPGRSSSVFQDDVQVEDNTNTSKHAEITSFSSNEGGENFEKGDGNEPKEVADLVIPVPAPRHAKKGEQGETENAGMPLLMANLPPELLGDISQDEKFKVDMSLRAGDIAASSQAYSTVPIAQFGEAMLRGMGWTGPSSADLATQEN